MVKDMRYDVEFVEAVFDEFDAFEHYNGVGSVSVEADSLESAMQKARVQKQKEISDERRGFSGWFDAEIGEVYADGKLLYNQNLKRSDKAGY